MEFQTKIILLSFVATVILSFIIIPLLKKLKVGQIEREDGPQSHLKKQGTPTMGGIIMIIVILVVGMFMYFDYARSEDAGESQMAQNLLPIIAVTLGFGIIGLIDDLKKLIGKNTKGLKPAYKMIGLLIVSVGFSLYLTEVMHFEPQIYIPFADVYFTLPVWIFVPFVLLVFLSTTNAINLTDGIDGLSTSVTTIIVACLTVISIVFEVKEITVFGAILIGTCLGFLVFNLYPAKVMMGDTGSLLLGGAIAGMAIYLKMPLLLLIIALVPILETLSVIIQVAHFKRTGERIFKMAPLHHHFELSGWKENKVVAVFSMVTLVCCVLGLMII